MYRSPGDSRLPDPPQGCGVRKAGSPQWNNCDVARATHRRFPEFSLDLEHSNGRSFVSAGIMSRSPSIVPREADQDIYVVLDDFVGAWLGRAWRETDEEDTDRETLIRDLMEGQYSHPARIVAFNTAEGWSRDVTVDIADELRRRFAEYDEVPLSVQEFVETSRR